MIIQFFFVIGALLNSVLAIASSPTHVDTQSTARSQRSVRSPRLSPLSAVSLTTPSHTHTHRSSAGYTPSAAMHPQQRGRRSRAFRFTPHTIAGSAVHTAAAQSMQHSDTATTHRTVLVHDPDDDSPPPCAAMPVNSVEEPPKRKSDSETRPVVPPLALNIISPKGTARTLKSLSPAQENERLRQEIDALKEQLSKQKKSPRRSANHQRSLYPQEEENVSITRLGAYSPRRPTKRRSFCNRWGKAILVGGVVACATSGGAFIAGTHLAASNSCAAPSSSPTFLEEQLAETQSALNASLAAQDRAVQSLAFCEYNVTRALADKTECESSLATTRSQLTLAKTEKEECVEAEAACETNLTNAHNSLSIALAAAGGLQTACQRGLNQSQAQLEQCQGNLNQTQAQLTATQTCYNAAYGLLSAALRLLLPSQC